MKHAYIVLMNDKNRDDHYVVELTDSDFKGLVKICEHAAAYVKKQDSFVAGWYNTVALNFKWCRRWLSKA